jgi:RNA-directed DNA polymerase
MGYQLFKVRQYMQGWINYFGIANAYQGCVAYVSYVTFSYTRVASVAKATDLGALSQLKVLKRGVRIQVAVACGRA